MKTPRHIKKAVRITALALSLLMLFSTVSAVYAASGSSKRVVRVGWYESPFNQTDEFGRRSGYAYEYQQKIAAYTGWTYEYVNGTWPELLQMLIDGKIDLMSDVSYTDERSELMYFSALPMGFEEYYLLVLPENNSISSYDLTTVNGKNVAVNKNSVQKDLFDAWCEQNNITVNLIEISYSNDDIIKMFQHGTYDAYVATDTFYSVYDLEPVSMIGSSDYYFAVSRSHQDLVIELNFAMERLKNEKPLFSQQLKEKYLHISGLNKNLTGDEKDWLAKHGAIRVGYQDNYLAFCAADKRTGELTGALKDYLATASDIFGKGQLSFEAICYPTASAAMEALKNGEIDCMFPANLTDFDGETQGYFMTEPIMRTDISAIVSEDKQNTFVEKEHVTVAVNAGNPNYNMFLVDNFPEWRSVYFKDTPECLKAISEGKADCLLMSNYRYNNIASLCKKYGLISLSTGVEMDYCFAVRRDDTVLYSVLNKVANVIPNASVNAALSYYFTEDAKTTVFDLIQENMGYIIAVSMIILLIVLFLIFNNAKSTKKASDIQQIVTATETDSITGLYTKSYFYEYASRLYNTHPDKPMDAVVLNVEQFHSINAANGWSFGDKVLSVIGDVFREYVKEYGGIAGHADADRFALYCPHMEEYCGLYDRIQKNLDSLSANVSIVVRMGVMMWEKGSDPHHLVEQALIACGIARGRFSEKLIVYDERMRNNTNLELRLKNDLKNAIANKEFKVYFQPKFDIKSDTPVLRSAEALVRWDHHELGMISPVDFVPLFEQTGQIVKVDKYVWSEAAAQIAAWREKYGKTVPVSVNLSRIDVFNQKLEETLDGIVEKYGIDRECFHLEITESAYTENTDQITHVIEKLREKGYRIEIDDFGTGYSSLFMLSSVPVDVLKMDSAFVRNIGLEKAEVQLVDVIINIAKKLNIPVTAEGVETEEQLKLLKELGCDTVQGYYFSRPIPAYEFESRFLKNE